MNYFELFNIQPNYELNSNDLNLAYLNLQKKYHPDNCQTTIEQLEAVEKTIEINNAFNILTDDVLLIVYYVKTMLNIELSSVDIQKNLNQDDLLYLLDLQEEIANNPLKINYYKQELKQKTLSIALKVKQAIKDENLEDLKINLSKLVFFNKSLKHI